MIYNVTDNFLYVIYSLLMIYCNYFYYFEKWFKNKKIHTTGKLNKFKILFTVNIFFFFNVENFVSNANYT